MRNQNLHAGHRKRLRDRAREDGLSRFEAHEALELLLFSAIPRRNVNQLAHLLIDRFGSLSRVLSATPAEIMSVPGVGENTALWLTRIGALIGAYSALEADDRPMLGNVVLARAFAASKPEIVRQNAVWQFCLSSEGRLLLSRPVAPPGTCTPEAFAQALDDAIAVHAHSVLLVQYTDRAPVAPVAQDRQKTIEYGRRLTTLSIHLLDHLLLGKHAFYSMHAHGDLDEMRFLGASDTALSEHYLDALPPRRKTRLREDEGPTSGGNL